MRKPYMSSPTKTQLILHELISQIPLSRNYGNRLRAYWWSGKIEGYLKTRVELKLFEKTLGFRNLFGNWSLEIYLEIGVSKIIWKLESSELNLRIGFLEIKFERNWNFENHLRIGTVKIKL